MKAENERFCGFSTEKRNVYKRFIVCFHRIHILFINAGYDATVSGSDKAAVLFISSLLFSKAPGETRGFFESMCEKTTSLCVKKSTGSASCPSRSKRFNVCFHQIHTQFIITGYDATVSGSDKAAVLFISSLLFSKALGETRGFFDFIDLFVGAHSVRQPKKTKK